jgi:hypothetical protein
MSNEDSLLSILEGIIDFLILLVKSDPSQKKTNGIISMDSNDDCTKLYTS